MEIFYRGFGLTVTTYLPFSAFLAWHLGGVAASTPAAIVTLARAIVGVQIACLALWGHRDLPCLGGVVAECDRALAVTSSGCPGHPAVCVRSGFRQCLNPRRQWTS